MCLSALHSGKAAAVKWLTVSGEAHVTSARAGPLLLSLTPPPPPPVAVCVSPERDSTEPEG